MTSVTDSMRLQDEMLEALEDELKGMLQFLAEPSFKPVAEMIAHHMGWGEPPTAGKGKRLRPLITLLSCDAAGGHWRDSLPIAASLELVHNFSLIHDDIEDASETRRGRPTVWKQWGVEQAINTGDTLFIISRLAAYRMMNTGLSAESMIRLLKLVDQACLALSKGQYQDLAFEDADSVSEAAYLEMIAGKTAALLSASSEAGAITAGAPPEVVESYRSFGFHLGLAFQILDDILGIWGSAANTGKPVGDDLRSRKKSLPVVLGMQRSKEFRDLWLSERTDPEAIQELGDLLKSAEALEDARDEAEKHTNLAIASLERASPSGHAGAALRKLAAELLNRQR